MKSYRYGRSLSYMTALSGRPPARGPRRPVSRIMGGHFSVPIGVLAARLA